MRMRKMTASIRDTVVAMKMMGCMRETVVAITIRMWMTGERYKYSFQPVLYIHVNDVLFWLCLYDSYLLAKRME